MNLFPRLTCLLPYFAVTATFGLMPEIRSLTMPLFLNALTTADDDCAEMPTGEQARLSIGVGVATATEAMSKREKIDERCIVTISFLTES